MLFSENFFKFGLLFIPAFFDFLLAFFVFYRRASKINIVFAWFCIAVGAWTLTIGIFGLVSINNALIWNKLFIASAGFIPSTFLHFVYLLMNKRLDFKKLFYIYLPSLIVSLQLIFSPKFYIKDLILRAWGKESILGPFYIYYGIYFVVYVCFGYLKVFLQMIKEKGVQKERCKYILVAMIPTATVGAYFNLFLILMGNYKYIWIGPYCSFIMVFVTTYAIIRYQLMDIRVAVTRTGIFIAVYSFVLGIPFAVAFGLKDLLSQYLKEFWWTIPLVISTVLAGGGPYIYLYIRKKAEDTIFREQRQYQHTLRQASLGMGRIKDLDRLLELIVHILSKTVRVTHCEIYLVDKEADSYGLKASRGLREVKVRNVKTNSALVNYFKQFQSPLVAEELKYKVLHSGDNELKEIKSMLLAMNSVLIIPSFVQDQLFAFISFGEKKSRDPYSADDVVIFSILANQAALAIENCIYHDEAKKRMHEEGLRERVTSLDAMASSFAHEVHNPVQGCMISLELLTEDINEAGTLSPETKESMLDSLNRITDNINRVSNMVFSMLDYSRKSSGEMFPVTVEQMLKAVNELVLPKMKEDAIIFKMEIEPNLPTIMGDKVQLEEIFVNFALNSVHALRNNALGDKFINCKVFRKNGHIRFEFSDNGYGIKKNLLEDIFLVSVTTKASSESTGLGLYRVRKIIELHKGKVWAESEGEGKGAKFIVELPVCSGNNNAMPEQSISLF